MPDYAAVIHKDTDTDFGVSFPDFSGCVTAGSSIDEAKDMAKEALPFHIHGMMEDGEPVPPPSSLDSIMSDPDFSNATLFLVISIPEAKNKTTRINITLQENTLHSIDIAAKKAKMSRSAFMVEASKKAIDFKSA